jgi:hypothetical protein
MPEPRARRAGRGRGSIAAPARCARDGRPHTSSTGVAVVPRTPVVPVLLGCERPLRTEERVHGAVRKGMAPLAACGKYGVSWGGAGEP